MSIRIAMWSGPRNISTAMMRAWESRADTEVWDEPFYGPYLRRTGIAHPMRAETLAARPEGWAEIAARCVADRPGVAILMQKHMCQHMLPEAPLGWMAACRHAFLIRDPRRVAASFARGFPGLSAADLGFARQAELFERVAEATGSVPPALDADQVLGDPETALRALCRALDVVFDPAMLVWAAGPRTSDGPWAPHWYRAVEASTGFAPPPAGPPPEPEGRLAEIVDACRADYERLRAHCLTLPATGP